MRIDPDAARGEDARDIGVTDQPPESRLLKHQAPNDSQAPMKSHRARQTAFFGRTFSKGTPGRGRYRALLLLLVVLRMAYSEAPSAFAKGPANAPVSSASASPGGGGVVPAQRALSTYEQDSLASGLARLGTRIESSPEGKHVESIEVVVLDVFEPRDPAPAFLNWFHVNTEDSIVRREVLIKPGQPYTALLAAESERNLRKFIQYSVVLVVPVQGSSPDKVRILVVTKDVWSLRLSWDPYFYQGRLTGLLLAPSELNLFGTTQTVSGAIITTQNNLWLGLTYYVPRIAGSRITATLMGKAQVDCKTGNVEGGSGQMFYGQPLFSTRTAWSWGVTSTFASQVERGSLGAASSICSAPGAAGVRVALAENLPNYPVETDVAYIPNIYRKEVMTTQIGATRSFFVRNKINVSFGLEGVRVRNSPLGPPSEIYVGRSQFSQDDYNRTCWPPGKDCAIGDPVSATPATDIDGSRVATLFAQQRLSPSMFRVGPYVQVHAFETNFVRLLNVNTLGLQEDFQLGHSVTLRAYPGVRPLASRNLIGGVSSIDYTLPVAGGFYRLGGTSTLEFSGTEDDFAKAGVRRSSRSDARIELRSFLVSPDLGLGRVVMGTTFVDQPQWRYVPAAYELGSPDRLRGYPASARQGRTVFVNNLEFRTRPLHLYSTALGLVAFLDSGSAVNGISNLSLVHGAGVGLRLLLPQIDRQVFRIDVGVPVESEPWSKYTITAGFRQAFGDE